MYFLTPDENPNIPLCLPSLLVQPGSSQIHLLFTDSNKFMLDSFFTKLVCNLFFLTQNIIRLILGGNHIHCWKCYKYSKEIGRILGDQMLVETLVLVLPIRACFCR